MSDEAKKVVDDGSYVLADGGPAFPVFGLSGMSLQQFAAIQLRVPDSGTDWLDDMIRQSRRDEFAGQALANAGFNFVTDQTAAHRCYELADAMLLARKGPSK